jgi:arylsulfatase A-like enzyme
VPLMSIDLVPTLCTIAEAPLPAKAIDGVDASGLLYGTPGAAGRESLVFYAGSELQAIRVGRWKLHFPHPYLVVNGETRTDGKPAGFGRLAPQAITNSGIAGIASRHGYVVRDLPLSLYNLDDDIGETVDVAAEHPDVVAYLTALADPYRSALGDSLTNRDGTETRPVGRATAAAE